MYIKKLLLLIKSTFVDLFIVKIYALFIRSYTWLKKIAKNFYSNLSVLSKWVKIA